MRTITLAALSLLLASACTPRHSYTPPETLEGQACVARCLDALEQCSGAERQPPGLEMEACVGEPRDKPLVCPPGTECPPAPCRYISDADGCGERYRQCYRDCGGEVDGR
jgi:hypothetical protein